MRSLDEFVDPANKKTLKTVVEEWDNTGLQETIKYVRKMKHSESTYTAKGLKTLFCSIECKALVLQDQTAYEELTKLEEKYRKIYVASVVHDIRTPLNGISGMLDMMDHPGQPEDQKVYLTVARNTCTLLLFLTYDITDYSQLEANKFKANNSKTQLKETIEEVFKLLSFSFERKRLSHALICDPSVPAILNIDRNRYTQILLNLLGNAVKFTFSGSINVGVTYLSESDLIVTEVTDTGIGIKHEDLPKLFKLFGKLDSSSSHNTQGVGLGLSICKRLSESLGGYIKVDSTEGVGSTFTFAIKANLDSLKQEHAEEEIRRRRSSSISLELASSQKNDTPDVPRFSLGKNFHSVMPRTAISPLPQTSAPCGCSDILIVDDNGYNLFVLQSYVKSIHLFADEASNGQEAIEAVVRRANNGCCGNYKIVVLDINMPVLDGIETARILRQKIAAGELPDMNILALSAQPLRPEDHDFFYKEVGFTDYLTKPTTKNVFLESIAKYGIC